VQVARKGFSIIEMLITVGILGVLLSGLGLIMMLGARYLGEAQAYSAGQQEVASALSRLELEMPNASSSQTYPGTSSVLFLSPDSPTGSSATGYQYALASGNLKFQKWVCYYVDSGQSLWRSEIPLSTPTEFDQNLLLLGAGSGSYAFPQGGVTNIVPFTHAPQKNVVAHFVSSFQVAQGAYANLFEIKVGVTEHSGVASSSDANKVWTRTLQTAVQVLN
jgi:prepilin-type N-terminal cleavage/methylation domain-containing protein